MNVWMYVRHWSVGSVSLKKVKSRELMKWIDEIDEM